MPATLDAPAALAPMSLARAEHYAVKILDWIGPYVLKAEVAGSIRRRRPTCNDVDIVCLPKREEVKDLTGAVIEQRAPLLFFLMQYVEENAARGAKFITGGGKTESPNQFIVQLPSCQLDLWLAEPANWGTRLVCRTGSKQFNIWLAMRAQTLQMRWNPYQGVFRQDQTLLPCPKEEDLFAQLKLDWIAPERRER